MGNIGSELNPRDLLEKPRRPLPLISLKPATGDFAHDRPSALLPFIGGAYAGPSGAFQHQPAGLGVEGGAGYWILSQCRTQFTATSPT